jgi:hypothetical protein
VLLALPVFAVALWIVTGRDSVADASTAEPVEASAGIRGRFAATLRRSWVPLLFVALPTFLLELSALISLGFDGFARHLRALGGFVRSGGQHYEPTTVAQKLTTLAGSWSLPTWAAIVLAIVSAAVIAGGLWITRSSASDIALYVWPAAVGALVFIAWWASAAHLPLWVRHPAPGVFAFFPILAAAAVWGCSVLYRSRGSRIVAVLTASVLVVGIGASAGLHVAGAVTADRWETLETQRAAVEPLRIWVAENDQEWLAAAPWGAAVSAIVMSGAHVGLHDAPAMADVPRLTGAECTTDVLADSGRYRICAAE